MRAMLAPTTLLAGRYRFSKTIQTGAKTVSWLATDTTTGKAVVASALGAPRVAGLEGVVGFRHAHLAALLDIIHEPDPADIPSDGAPVRAAAVAVAEFVPGQTLHARLKNGPGESEEAVGWLYGLAEAVHQLHQFGGLHGAISPRSVIVEPRGSEVAPVLTQLLAAPNGPYCAPERLLGGGPDAADDVWALHALLYSALTGAAPFSGTTREELVASMEKGPKALAQLGLEDELLASILSRGLAPDRGNRVTDAASLREELDTWQRSGRASQISVPSIEENESAASDTQTEWDDEDAKTTVTTAAALADMVRSMVPPAPAAPPRQRVERPRGPLPPLPLPPPSMPPAPSISPGPVPPDADDNVAALRPYADEDEDDPTRVVGSDDVHAFRAAGFPEPETSPDEAETEPAPAAEPVAAPPSSGAELETASVAAGAPAPRPGRSGMLLATLGLIAIAIATAVYLARRPASGPVAKPIAATPPIPQPAAPTAPTTNEHPATPAPPDSAATQLAGAAAGAKPANLAACVASYFPAGTFTGSEDFEFMCKDTDFRGINSLLYRRIVVAGAGKVTPGMREWSGLDWFEMPTTAVIRDGCCPAPVAKPQLPDAPGPCPQIADVLEKLPSMVHPDTIKQAANSFGDAVICMYKHGIPRRYSYGKQPTGSNQYLFEQFLTRAANR